MLLNFARLPQDRSSTRESAYLFLAILFVLSLSACREQQRPAPSTTTEARRQEVANPAASSVSVPTQMPTTQIRQLPESSESCSLDSVNDQFFTGTFKVKHGVAPALNGWVSNQARAPAGRFDIILVSADKAFSFTAETGLPRPDVAQHFKAPELAASGFRKSIDTSLMPRDSYAVIYAFRDTSATTRCETGKSIALD